MGSDFFQCRLILTYVTFYVTCTIKSFCSYYHIIHINVVVILIWSADTKRFDKRISNDIKLIVKTGETLIEIIISSSIKLISFMTNSLGCLNIAWILLIMTLRILIIFKVSRPTSSEWIVIFRWWIKFQMIWNNLSKTWPKTINNISNSWLIDIYSLSIIILRICVGRVSTSIIHS